MVSEADSRVLKVYQPHDHTKLSVHTQQKLKAAAAVAMMARYESQHGGLRFVACLITSLFFVAMSSAAATRSAAQSRALERPTGSPALSSIMPEI